MNETKSNLTQRSIRAFIAIEIPNESTLDAVESYQRKLQKSIGHLKLVDRKLMHITIRFLGNISEEDAVKIALYLKNELNPEFFGEGKKYTGYFKGVGDFNKRTFFAKITDVQDLLLQINRKIEDKLKDFCDIHEETREFRAHLTIARAKRQKYQHGRKTHHKVLDDKDNAGQIPYFELKRKFQTFNFGEWTIGEVVLKKSILTPSGPIYSIIEG